MASSVRTTTPDVEHFRQSSVESHATASGKVVHFDEKTFQEKEGEENVEYNATIRAIQSPVPSKDLFDLVQDETALTLNENSEILDSNEKYRRYTRMVATAAKEGKTFQVMYFFDVGKIKEELKKRGFIEIPAHVFHKIEHQRPIWELIELAEDGNDYEEALIAKLIGNYPPDYMWVPMPCYYHTFSNTPWLNKIFIEQCDFGLKDGLCDCVAKLNSKSVLCDTDVKYPRSYIAYRRKEVEAFQADFKFTKCINLLTFLYDRDDVFSIFHNEGTVEQPALDVLMTVILRHIKNVVEKRPDFKFAPNELEWKQLEKAIFAIMHQGAKVKCVGDDNDIILYYGNQLKFVMGEVFRVWPMREFDGIRNFWLMKPAYSGQGYGIVISNDENVIMSYVNNLSRRYIIQKYIEKPFLIYNTKFDIRQYFMITIEEDCITAWTHPICSFKFASHQFTLDDTHESIHLTNSSIQHKYLQSRYDDSPLPLDLLWSNIEFDDYVKDIGKGDIFMEQIYPSMKRALKALTIASLPYIDPKPGRFELFGCDWILSEDFSCNLLEVNYAPGLGYIANVSKFVCGTIMEDVVKVTVDYMRNRSAQTGGFEKIFQTPVYKSNFKRFVNVEEAEKKLSGKFRTPTANFVNYHQN